jgi:adenine deaminase
MPSYLDSPGKVFVKTLCAAVAFSACLAFAQERPTAEMSIRHVTVVNVATGAELKDQPVRIHGDRIASIAPTQDTDNTPGSVDAHGAFIIPGPWDMHVHVQD